MTTPRPALRALSRLGAILLFLLCGTGAAHAQLFLSMSCTPTSGPTQVGVAYSATCTPSGGFAPYTWIINAGALPDGVTIAVDSNGIATIAGTPTTAGAYSYVVQVTDSTPILPQTAQQSYSGTISPATTTLTVGCSPNTGPTQIGLAYSATCTGSGGTVPYSWSISAGTLPDGLTLTTNSDGSATVSGTPTTAGAYSYTVQVSDSSTPTAQTAQQSYSGTISPATTTLTVGCSPNTGPTQVGVSYSATCTATGGTPPYNWSLSAGSLPDGLTLVSNGATATISGTPTTAGAYSYTVQVADSSTPTAQTAQQSYSGTISPATTTLTVGCSPNTGPTQVGVAYSATCTASGGTVPYSWSISAGSLPNGVKLVTNPDGSATISGTPTTAGDYSYTVQVADSSTPTPQTAPQSYSGTISPAAPPTLTLGCSPTTGPTQVQVAYSATCTAAGGTPPYNWSLSGALPPGVTLTSSGSGATISGAPTTASSYSYTVQLSDSGSPAQTAQQPYSGTINALVGISCVPASGPTEVGIPYSATCTGSGGTAPYSWSVSSGSLPPGVTFSAHAGSSITISGAPISPGSYSYTVRVTDSASQTADQPYSGTIVPPVRVSCVPPTGPTQVGVSYSATCTASNGVGPYSWLIVPSPASLPPGLTLGSSGATATISGTPTTPGAYTYTVQVTDGVGGIAGQPYSGNVGAATPGLAISCTPITGPTEIGVAYSATCTASGGTSPYSWLTSSGSLPNGIKQSGDTGASITISGTPTTAGAYNYSVQVTDSTTPTAQTAHQSYSGTVNTPAVAISITGLPPVAVLTQQPTLGVQLVSAYPTALQGTLTLSFTPSIAGLPAGYMDPALQFSCGTGVTCTSGNTVLTFTIPAGTTTVSSLPGGTLQQGTVAGSITVTVTSLTSNGKSVLPQAPVTAAATIQPLVPVITAGSVKITNLTASGFNVQLTGYSTTREVTTANFSFTAASGTQLTGTTSFSVPVTTAFSTWFDSTQGQANGSLFSLSVPFTFSGSTTAIQSVSVTLTNSVGTSTAVSGKQ